MDKEDGKRALAGSEKKASCFDQQRECVADTLSLYSLSLADKHTPSPSLSLPPSPPPSPPPSLPPSLSRAVDKSDADDSKRALAGSEKKASCFDPDAMFKNTLMSPSTLNPTPSTLNPQP